jgi:hypothetical protein
MDSHTGQVAYRSSLQSRSGRFSSPTASARPQGALSPAVVLLSDLRFLHAGATLSTEEWTLESHCRPHGMQKLVSHDAQVSCVGSDCGLLVSHVRALAHAVAAPLHLHPRTHVRVTSNSRCALGCIVLFWHASSTTRCKRCWPRSIITIKAFDRSSPKTRYLGTERAQPTICTAATHQ